MSALERYIETVKEEFGLPEFQPGSILAEMEKSAYSEYAAAILRGDTYKRRAMKIMESARLDRRAAVIALHQDKQTIDNLRLSLQHIADTKGRNGHTASNMVLYARDVLKGLTKP